MTIIGIDPDVSHNGIALYSSAGGYVLSRANLPDTIAYIVSNKPDIVIISAGWLNKKTNFHKFANSEIGMKIAERVGGNHAIGKELERQIRALGFPVLLAQPRSKKVDSKTFIAATGYVGKSNQDSRDAAMCIWHYLQKNELRK